MRSGKTEYAMRTAREVGRGERAVLVTIQAQLERGQTVIGRSTCRNAGEAEKKALKNNSVNEDSAERWSPEARPFGAKLISLDPHGGENMVKHGRRSSG